MRFSDMMGSGAEPPSEPSASPSTEEHDPAVAAALAPYIGSGHAPDPLPAPPTKSVAEVFPVVPVTAVAAVAPVNAGTPVETAVPVDTAPPTRVPEYAPLSDDLLPRRR